MLAELQGGVDEIVISRRSWLDLHWLDRFGWRQSPVWFTLSCKPAGAVARLFTCHRDEMRSWVFRPDSDWTKITKVNDVEIGH